MSSIKEAVIISAVRTPVGKFLGALKSFKATELGAIVVREAVRRAGVKPEEVDEVIMGCVIQAGLGQNPARQAALRGGIPFGVSAVTVNKVCGSGLKSVMMAAQGVQLGDSEVVVAGGMECMSNAPGVNDGASAVVVTSLERARALGVEPLARIAAQATSGIQPELVMMAPVEAIRKVLRKAGWSLSEVDLIELNEAFAVQAVAI